MNKKKILLIEDEAIISLNIKTILIQKGYEVCGTGSTAKEAIKLTQKYNPDLIIMDIFLKGKMDGISAVEEIKEKYDIPIIYLTAHSDKKTLERAKKTGPHGYIIKPVSENDIYAIIEIAFYKHKMDKKLRENEANLSQAERIAHIGNWNWNIPENKIMWSDELYCIVGLTPEEFGANYDSYLGCIHPDDMKKFMKLTEKVLDEKKPYDAEYRIIRPGGEVRVVHERGEVTVDKKNNPIGTIGTVQDITERKKTEEVLLISKSRLEVISTIGNIVNSTLKYLITSLPVHWKPLKLLLE